jgi:TolA-binding protein
MALSSRSLRLIIVLAVITFGSGCVYYNTFFMARQKFNDAEKSQEANRLSKLRIDDQTTGRQNQTGQGGQGRSMLPNTPPSQPIAGIVTSPVTQQERTLYEDAITKANLVLTLHPESKWVDDALWLIGKSNFNMGEYLKAEKNFKELITNHPGSKYIDDAYFYMGMSLVGLDLKEQALTAFANIENSEKKSPYMEYVLFAKGNIEFSDENYDSAIEIYTQFIGSYPSSDSASMAMFNIGKCHEKKKEYADAYESYGRVEKYSPSRRLHFDAALAQATTAIAEDSVAIGMKILTALSKDERYFSRAGEINLKSAEGYLLQGDIDKAIEIYNDVTVQNPRTAQAAEAYYRLGVIYQEKQYDLEKAKSSFTKAQNEFGDSEFRALALARSAQIAKLESYQAQLQRADSLARVQEMEALGQDMTSESQTSVTADSLQGTIADTIQASVDTLQAPHPDSTQAQKSDTLSVAKADTITAKPDTAVSKEPPVITATPDTSEAFNPDTVASVAADTSAKKAISEPRAGMLSGVDTTGFGNLTPTERMQRLFSHAIGDSASVVKRDSLADTLNTITGLAIAPLDTSKTVAKDTVAAVKVSSVPQKQSSAEIEKANQDSIRQAIVQSGIETRFLLAELYAYELNRPDSALEEYLLIAHEYPQSQYAPKALLAASRIKFAEGDSASGREFLTQLLNDYAQSPQADEAARTMNSPVNPLNAIELYSTAERLVYSGENPDSAVILYKYIANNFPDLAPKAAYAAAWTLDQVIGTEDSSAFYAYTDITKKYPHTEFAAAASDRITASTKKSTRKSSQSQEQSPSDSTGQKTLPDSAAALAESLPFAPQVVKPGVFIYPEKLLSKDLKGKVLFKVKLSFSGKVEDYQMIGPFGEHLIDSTATEALLQTEFDVSSLSLSDLDGYFQYSIVFERPDINMYNDIYRERRDTGP